MGWGQDVKDKVQASAGRVAEAVKEQVQAMAAGASELAGMARNTAGDWASSVGDAAVHAKNKVRDVTSAVAGKAVEVEQDVTALIRRHPLEALLAGFGAGIVVGFLAAQVVRRS
jgi:ElaB/YqjD/DUF883 family membrane-anchored ribosome-binding protein